MSVLARLVLAVGDRWPDPVGTMAVSARNVRCAASVLPSVARAKPVAPANSTLDPVQRDLLELQRSAGNHAVSLVVQREPAADAGYKIISEIYRVAERDIVVVATGHGDQVLFFYKRTGDGPKGVGIAPPPDSWTPFKTLMSQDDSIIKPKPGTTTPRANPKEAWINKNPYYNQVDKWDPKRGYANQRNQDIGHWLDEQNLPKGSAAKDWQTIEHEMDQIANDYRAKVRASTGSSGTGSGTVGQHGAEGGGEAKGGAAEARGAGLEAKAAGAEAKALGTEAKLVGAEVTGAMKTESVLTKGAQIAAKGAKVARISELVIALGMPGPQDVFFMFIAAFASIAEAKAKLKADAYATGFAEGVTAVVTWTTADEATNMLMERRANPGMGERVAGFEGVREHGNNEGVAAGWKFGNALNGEQRKGFRHLMLDATGLKEQRHTSKSELIAMAMALRPTIVDLLAEAARQEQEREDKEKAEMYARMAAARRR